jgi:hypothetical protein
MPFPRNLQARKESCAGTQAAAHRIVEDHEKDIALLLSEQMPPIFVPMKTGCDAETQIYDGDLFDFDVEVDPILEVLVGKTLEQSMLEVMEEEELAAMKDHQEHFEQIRNVELAAPVAVERVEEGIDLAILGLDAQLLDAFPELAPVDQAVARPVPLGHKISDLEIALDDERAKLHVGRAGAGL